jgi:hypothetical protein
MLICAAHGYPSEGRPDVETFVGAKLPFGVLPGSQVLGSSFFIKNAP